MKRENWKPPLRIITFWAMTALTSYLEVMGSKKMPPKFLTVSMTFQTGQQLERV